MPLAVANECCTAIQCHSMMSLPQWLRRFQQKDASLTDEDAGTMSHICGPDLEDSDPTEQPEIDLSPEDVVPWKIGRPGRPGRPGIVDMDAT